MSKKKDNKIIKWDQLNQYKEVIPIMFKDEVLFEMHELSELQIREILEIYKIDSDDSTNENKEQIFDASNNAKILAFCLKSICVGVDFEGLSDENIINNLERFGNEICRQINSALNILITQRLYQYGQDLEAMANNLGKLINESNTKETTVN